MERGHDQQNDMPRYSAAPSEEDAFELDMDTFPRHASYLLSEDGTQDIIDGFRDPDDLRNSLLSTTSSEKDWLEKSTTTTLSGHESIHVPWFPLPPERMPDIDRTDPIWSGPGSTPQNNDWDIRRSSSSSTSLRPDSRLSGDSSSSFSWTNQIGFGGALNTLEYEGLLTGNGSPNAYASFDDAPSTPTTSVPRAPPQPRPAHDAGISRLIASGMANTATPLRAAGSVQAPKLINTNLLRSISTSSTLSQPLESSGAYLDGPNKPQPAFPPPVALRRSPKPPALPPIPASPASVLTSRGNSLKKNERSIDTSLPPSSEMQTTTFDDSMFPTSNRTSRSTLSSMLSRSRSSSKRSSRASRRSRWNEQDAPPLPNTPPSRSTRSSNSTKRSRKRWLTQERDMPLNDLIRRSQTLSMVLDSGQRASQSSLAYFSGSRTPSTKTKRSLKSVRSLITPRHSYPSRPISSSQASYFPLSENNESLTRRRHHPAAPRNSLELDEIDLQDEPPAARTSPIVRSDYLTSIGRDLPPIPKRASIFPRTTKRVRSIACVVLLALLVLIITLAATLSKNKNHSKPNANCDKTCLNGGIPVLSDNGSCVCQACDTGWGGSYCHLASTCEACANCSTNIASAILGALTAASTFDPPVDASAFSNLLSQNDLGGQGSDCSNQLFFMDLSSNLNPIQFPTLTAWAGSALLWDVFASWSLNSTLLQAALALPLQDIFIPDKATPSPQKTLQATSHGYVFDFGQRSVSPSQLRWRSIAKPSSEQRSRVDSGTMAALNRLVSYASASNDQRTGALVDHWTNTLNLDKRDLSTFVRMLAASEIMLFVDAGSTSSGQPMSDLAVAAEEDATAFPLAPSCDSNISDDLQTSLSNLEQGSFGLLDSTQASCAAGHPTYGVLNLFGSKLPFPGQASRPQQGIVLTSDAISRAIFHAGSSFVDTVLSQPGGSASATNSPAHYGTSTLFNHVALDWLSIMDASTARTVAQGLLKGKAPPSGVSVPPIEVAMFGQILFQDVGYSVSGLTTADGSVFFGTSAGTKWRTWAEQGNSNLIWTTDGIAYTNSSTKRQRTTFERIWDTSAGQSAEAIQGMLEQANLL